MGSAGSELRGVRLRLTMPSSVDPFPRWDSGINEVVVSVRLSNCAQLEPAALTSAIMRWPQLATLDVEEGCQHVRHKDFEAIRSLAPPQSILHFKGQQYLPMDIPSPEVKPEEKLGEDRLVASGGDPSFDAQESAGEPPELVAPASALAP